MVNTVGIVVVAHSHALAGAAVALACEMLHGRPVPIALAAGLDETTFGTDAVRVKDAIEEIDDGSSGVLVLLDLGSAVLSAELALDLLDPDVAARVRLCAAPLVEGLVAAAVAAAGGAPLAEVEAEATGALAGKQSHLRTPGTEPGPEEVEEPSASATFVLANAHGLHARPAAKLVAEIRTLDARVRLRNVTTGSTAVPGSSLTRVATLGALKGHEIEVTATGSQAKEAVEHVVALATRRFDEEDGLPPPAAASPGERPAAAAETGAAGRAGPLPASPGIAIGPARLPGATAVDMDGLAGTASDPEAEWRRVRTAVAAARNEIIQIRARTAREAGEAEAAIFDAHLILLEDPDLLADLRRRIDAGRAAPHAWSEALLAVAAGLEALPDEYQRARAADVRALREQVLQAMLGEPAAAEVRPGVLIVPDVTPAQAAVLDPSVVDGLVLAYSSPTAHGVILARSRGIPAIVGAGPEVLRVEAGTTVALDGATGRLAVDPDPGTLAGFKVRSAEQAHRYGAAMAAAHQPVVSRDGRAVHVAANVGSAGDAAAAVAHGADLAGLVRTEFVFLGRDAAPSADEQETAYREIVEALDGRRAVFRTLDVGGDKPVPYVRQPAEANPFLGLRGIRLALTRPELLRDQLQALCRLAADAPLGVMFPMVTHAGELLAARRLLAEAAGGTVPDGLEVGAMVEVPAAALKAAALVPHVDFLSIGMNDLTQYTLAADRGNDALAAMADPLDPAVLRLVDQVCRAAAGRVRVAGCGEVASEPVAIPLLLGLGVDELSVTPRAVPTVKQVVRELDVSACRPPAELALAQSSAADVRNLTA